MSIFLLTLLASPAECFISGSNMLMIENRGPRLLMQSRSPSFLQKVSLLRTVQMSSNKDDDFLSAKSVDVHHGISFSGVSKTFCRLSPLWTILSAGIAMKFPSLTGPTIGSLPVMQTSLSILMIAMGLTITPDDMSRAIQKPYIILLNILLCFGMMPIVAVLIAALLNLSPEHNAGLILLGCVSGGQASNLFALLAGGDVALSVACTLSTTLLGTIVIPLLVKCILNCIVVVDSIAVLKSVAQLVLFPLLLGLSLGKLQPSFVQRLQSVCPLIGVLATLVLVAGGASNCAFVTGGSNVMLASYLLPILGAIFAWAVSFLKLGQTGKEIEEPARRTLVVETLSKSPTLAYVLAKKHFGETSASIPAAGMVSLAIVGAAVATIWAYVDPIGKYQHAENKNQ